MLLRNTLQFCPNHRRNYRSKNDHAFLTAIVGFVVSFEERGGRLPTSDFKAVGLTIKLSAYLQKTKNYETYHYEIFRILLAISLS
jgi:hypothetical protein